MFVAQKKRVRLSQTLRIALEIAVEPREFCRNWFEADETMEASWGYRAKCIDLLSKVTGVSPVTINNSWGSGIDFPNMPSVYRKTLAYADVIRYTLSGLRDSDLLDAVLEYLNRHRSEK